MNMYALRYLSGYQTKLKRGPVEYVAAASLQDALRTKSDWPIEIRYDCTSAWAKNPGTSLYYVEAWEAECCPPATPAPRP
ncbi:MAG: hypothetical protein FWG59_05685 [Betaproteobacteria bacterium]|nr:hypothetical protein [Betaproteobacteria bacterium]